MNNAARMEADIPGIQDKSQQEDLYHIYRLERFWTAQQI